MRIKKERPAVPYSYLIDNFKVLLIFLVVFNHIIAFNLVKVDTVVRYVWYAITIFHMPAFIFVSGYLSKKPQNALKNFKNLLIPYILGYTLTWYSQIWLGRSVDYEILRPTGTVMWYILALFIYRLTIEALGKIRFIVPISIAIALWAGTRPEFTTFLSASRIVVFFPFFVAGYLWKSEYITAVRKFKGKWVLVPISAVLLWAIPNYMITNDMGIAIFRGNHGYKLCGLTDPEGIILRLLMYLVSFILIYTLLALLPDIKLPLTYVGRHTMGIYFFHYPIMIIMNGLYILQIPEMNNVWALLGVSLVFVLVLGSLPVDLLYTGVLNLIAFILIKKDKTVRDEGLEEEYDREDHEYELLRRKKAIEELAATLDSEREQDGHMQKINLDDDLMERTSDKHEGFSNVAGTDHLDIEEYDLDDIPDEQIKNEEEELLSLEDLIQELEKTTRNMKNNDLLDELKQENNSGNLQADAVQSEEMQEELQLNELPPDALDLDELKPEEKE
ncbi:MAG: acyltransferase family protein [Blautia sp.]|uniref:acyltransferase family protein n=1 Tax=Blautia sp. TaxID=1955243 RepID=UPI0025BB775A|nr:acyltransferase family protein [Blautia sp.]MCI7450087.1 acyltransferase family protein [Blautia sp.]